VGHCGLTAKRSRSWSNEATISSPMAISPPRACSFAAPPKREAPKVPSRLERRLIPSHLRALARLARLPISPKHANGISAPPSSAQVPPRSNWRVSRTFVEVKTAWATGLCALPRSNAAVLGRLVAPKNDFPASNSQISMLYSGCLRQFLRIADPHHTPALDDVMAGGEPGQCVSHFFCEHGRFGPFAQTLQRTADF